MKERKAIYDKSMEPIAAGDVVVKFSGSMGSEWEISKITNMSPDEVKKLLYDMALLNESEWDGDYNAYLKEHGAEMTLISSSAGLNEHAPKFFDFAYDADTGRECINGIICHTAGREPYQPHGTWGNSLYG